MDPNIKKAFRAIIPQNETQLIYTKLAFQKWKTSKNRNIMILDKPKKKIVSRAMHSTTSYIEGICKPAPGRTDTLLEGKKEIIPYP